MRVQYTTICKPPYHLHPTNNCSDRRFTNNPYPLYAQLRQEAPVVWSERMGAWLITHYDDLLATLRDTRHFSSQGRMLAPISPIRCRPW